MIELGSLPITFVVTAASVFGLAIGSFLNVVIYRLPRGESLSMPGSHCPGCQAPVALWDNIPVLSFLILRGHCRVCHVSISPRYPAIELLTAMTFGAIAWQYGPIAMMPVFCVFGAALIAASTIDIDHRIIPDEISVGGLVAGLLLAPLGHWADAGRTGFVDFFLAAVVGAALGGGLLWSVGFFHARLSVALGREFEHWPGEGEEIPKPSELDYWIWFPGMGFGDVKLLAMIGAFLGPVGVVSTVLLASVLGLILGVAWGLATRSWTSPFGFGPAIAGAALISLLIPDPLILIR